MSAHTPGPWTVDPRKKLRVIAENDNTVASTGCTDSLRDQWEANARLIAAAPTMYSYIASSASNGCAEAAKIMEAIYGSR